MTILQNSRKNFMKKFQLKINKLALVLLISIPFISFFLSAKDIIRQSNIEISLSVFF
jgi:hypothetical protein